MCALTQLRGIRHHECRLPRTYAFTYIVTSVSVLVVIQHTRHTTHSHTHTWVVCVLLYVMKICARARLWSVELSPNTVVVLVELSPNTLVVSIWACLAHIKGLGFSWLWLVELSPNTVVVSIWAYLVHKNTGIYACINTVYTGICIQKYPYIRVYKYRVYINTGI